MSRFITCLLISSVNVIAYNHHFFHRSGVTTRFPSAQYAATVDITSVAESVADTAAAPLIPVVEPVAMRTDLLDAESRIAGALKILNSKTSSIYRDKSFDEEGSLSTEKKPPLLFLPGLDGIGNYSADSVSKLNLAFDVWKMATVGDDRSTFIELATFVIKALEVFGEPVVLVGESFGGLLAAYVALRAKKGSVAKLILVNPATSFDRTNWNLVAPIIASTGLAFPVVGISALLATAVDLAQIRRYSLRAVSKMNSAESAIKSVNTWIEAGRFLLDLIPPVTLNWRILNWFNAGTSIMEGKYSKIDTPTLILVGKNDRLLPSQAEGKRLKKEMTSAPIVEVIEFDIGHALLENNFQDFTSVILKSKVFAVPEVETLDCAMPTRDDMDLVEKQYGTFLNAISPVFLTRGADRQLVRGLESVPTGKNGRPVLLVGNHQLYGADLAPIVRQFITEKETLVRGLAHPAVFAEGAGGQMSQFKKFGAVKVSPSSIFELLKRNETVMLFPGGAKEALHGKGDEYKLFWPERVDFVRMAGLLDAIIVPFSAVGMSDSANIILDQEDIRQIPFMRDRTKGSGMPSARAGIEEDLLPPLFIPKAPERNYFLFGQPFDTRDLNIYNKKECKAIYAEVKGSVEDGIQTLLRFRENDPYREFVPRAIYEFASGGRQAPTAPLNLK